MTRAPYIRNSATGKPVRTLEPLDLKKWADERPAQAKAGKANV